LTALSIVPLAVLQREIRFKRHSGAISAAALGAAVVAIASALLGAGVWALVVRQILYGALVSALAWWNVRDLLPRADAGRAPTTLRDHRRGASAFFVLAAANLVALNADYVIVGNATDGRQLGLYSLAFMLGFAPLTNFSWKIGAVLFPALSASEDRSMVVSRTLRALRLMSLALLPLVVPAVVLAPSLLPAVLGSDWEAMVLPFQILIVAGVGHALINVFGEALSGTGNIRLHAALQVLMGVAVTAVMLVLVHADGIRGAAIAHLIVLVPIAAGYVVVGGRRLGIDGRAAAAAIAPVAGPVAAQAVATVLAVGVLTAAGVAEAAGALAGALIGCAVAALVFRFSPWNAWHETSALLRFALHRAGP
jgi:O-antigen/teichoic acid export membrane protein